jgi:hypothetical protein
VPTIGSFRRIVLAEICIASVAPRFYLAAGSFSTWLLTPTRVPSAAVERGRKPGVTAGQQASALIYRRPEVDGNDVLCAAVEP